MVQTKKLLIGVGAVIGIIVIVLLGLMAFAPETVQEAVPHERTITIASGTYTVDPGTTRKFSFSVPYDASDVRVKLEFEAKGGSGDDIIVKIVDSNGRVVYNSGQVTKVYTTVNLYGGGTYYLVLDNTFSLISSKDVTINAKLVYIG
ncbi:MULTISPECIES: emp24/gp25L/p24 family protein [Thermococcus]|uniref:emp24/gp25L/p24 family protein n=1 Tax=Thermococcus TaxID=2263 RepID=UPI0003EA1E42|nr:MULTISPECIES: emp24/gp25L/p24 family protein [Thermococcus]NJD98517.1 emp24/gp25L/p24 family protein [Thermococcus sp. LS1]